MIHRVTQVHFSSVSPHRDVTFTDVFVSQEADVTFTDVFVYQLHVATDFPLPRAAPATSIQDKDNNSERSGPLGSPALLEHALLWSSFLPVGKQRH